MTNKGIFSESLYKYLIKEKSFLTLHSIKNASRGERISRNA